MVVGRITEIGQNRWRADINARQDAVLMLSSINLPGGVQVYYDSFNLQTTYILEKKVRGRCICNAKILFRRRLVECLVPRDLISTILIHQAEIQQYYGDGSASIHTRSTKYGKVSNLSSIMNL